MGVHVKKVTKIASKMLQLEYNKSNNIAYGAINGYNIAIRAVTDETKTIKLCVWACASKELHKFERKLLRGTKYQNATLEQYGFISQLTWDTGHSIDESAMQNMCEMVKWYVKLLKDNEYVNCDERGYVGSCDAFYYDDQIHYLNKKSQEIILKEKKEALEAFIHRREKMVLGAVATIPAAIIGVALLWLLKDFGKIVALSGLCMGLPGGYCYYKKAEKFTIISVTICFTIFFTVTCLVFPFLKGFDFGYALLAAPLHSLVYLIVFLFVFKPTIKMDKLEEK